MEMPLDIIMRLRNSRVWVEKTIAQSKETVQTTDEKDIDVVKTEWDYTLCFSDSTVRAWFTNNLNRGRIIETTVEIEKQDMGMDVDSPDVLYVLESRLGKWDNLKQEFRMGIYEALLPHREFLLYNELLHRLDDMEDKAEKYKGRIADVCDNLGIKNPIQEDADEN